MKLVSSITMADDVDYHNRRANQFSRYLRVNPVEILAEQGDDMQLGKRFDVVFGTIYLRDVCPIEVTFLTSPYRTPNNMHNPIDFIERDECPYGRVFVCEVGTAHSVKNGTHTIVARKTIDYEVDEHI